jgi:SAM-dependent methyltransferase
VPDRMTDDEIFRFWQSQVAKHGDSHLASWSDRYVIELELRELTARLSDGDRVLDIGCANGFSTLRMAEARKIAIRGLDYVPEMVDEARAALDRRAQPPESEVEFAVGDMTDLAEPADRYDKVVATRVTISLGDWECQLAGLREAIRVLRPGGTLLLADACVQGWRALNRFRGEWGLDPIPVPAFNNYLDQDRVIEALAPEARLVELVNFASSYYVGTRVLKPLLARAAAQEIEVPDPLMEWNRWCSQLPAAGDYGVQALLVFEKSP